MDAFPHIGKRLAVVPDRKPVEACEIGVMWSVDDIIYRLRSTALQRSADDLWTARRKLRMRPDCGF